MIIIARYSKTSDNFSSHSWKSQRPFSTLKAPVRTFELLKESLKIFVNLRKTWKKCLTTPQRIQKTYQRIFQKDRSPLWAMPMAIAHRHLNHYKIIVKRNERRNQPIDWGTPIRKSFAVRRIYCSHHRRRRGTASNGRGSPSISDVLL